MSIGTSDQREFINVFGSNDSSGKNGYYVTEGEAGESTGFALVFDAPANSIDSDSFDITHTDNAVAEKFTLVKVGEKWELKLKAGQTLDAETDGASISLGICINNDLFYSNLWTPVVIEIRDKNEFDPELTVNPSSFEISEAVVAGSFTEVIFRVTDADRDDSVINPNGFSITLDTGDANPNTADQMALAEKFEVFLDGNLWKLKLKDGETLDAEDRLLETNDAGEKILKLKVKYTDGKDKLDENSNDDEVNVVLTITNVEEGAARFGITGYGTTPTVGNTLNVVITASDPDGDGTNSYAWYRVSNAGTVTKIANATGIKYVLTDDDIGHTIQAKITYTDGSGHTHKLTYATSDSVIDNNNHTPVLSLVAGISNTVDVRENSTNVNTGIRFTIEDEDVGVNVFNRRSFKIIDTDDDDPLMPPDNRFDIVQISNENTYGVWELQLIKGLDYEDGSSINLAVSVNDSVNESAAINIVVNVVNIPELTIIGGSSAAVDENVAGDDTGVTLSIDNGRPITTDDTFTILSDGVEDDRFEVIEESGVWKLKLKATQSLDAEDASLDDGPSGTKLMNLKIKVHDGIYESAEVSVNVQVNDLPELEAKLTDSTTVKEPVMVMENDAGADTGITLSVDDGRTITASDMFTILRDGAKDDRFEVIQENGKWKLKLKATQSLDAETETAIDLTITFGDDNTVAPVDIQIKVGDENESPPIFVESTLPSGDQYLTIYEDAEIGDAVYLGDSIFELKVSDSDVNHEDLTVSFVQNKGNQNFELAKESRDDGNGNVEVFWQIKLARTLDFEASGDRRHTKHPNESFDAFVSDGSRTSASEGFVIRILNRNDTAPVLELRNPSKTEARVDENASGVALGIEFKATDADDTISNIADLEDSPLEATEFTFTISGTHARRFEVVKMLDTNGDPLTLTESSAISHRIKDYRWQLKLKDGQSLDYEKARSFDLQITANDGIHDSEEVSVTIRVNNINETTNIHSPHFSNTEIFASESDTGVIGRFSATDKDMDTLEYSIIDSEQAGLFEINSSNGDISIASGRTLNYEVARSHSLTIQVLDGGDKKDVIVGTVNVDDANDAPVVSEVTYKSTFGDGVSENVDTPTVLVSIQATDEDKDDLHYSIESGNDAGLFSINADGDISLVNALDYETATTHSLTVQVSDGEHMPITTTVTVNVTDANDNAPAITIRGAHVASVDESDAGAHTGLTFIVKDVDVNANATFTTNSFSISHATDATLANKFEIVALRDENDAVKVDADGNTIWALKLKSTASLDYGTDNAHKLAITVNDGAKDSPARNVTVNVEKAIHGTNGNDTLTGTAEGENIHGNAGNDTITGGGGRDIIYGGAGLDTLTGGASDDTFYLDTANIVDSNADIVTDFTRNSNGGDRILLDIDGEGRRIDARNLKYLQGIANIRWEVADKTVAGSASDSDSDKIDNTIIYHTRGTDTESDDVILMVLEDFSDSLTLEMFDLVITAGDEKYYTGGAGDDIIYGSAGDDELRGRDGNDTIYGGEDNDDIHGGNGHDRIDGGDGNDRLDGGSGKDILYGRGGDDVFYSYVAYRYGSAQNIVADFREDGTDRIGLIVGAYVSADVTRFTTIEELKSFANIRFDNTINKPIPGYETRENDASVMDTVIYDTRGTSDKSDDGIVVVLEDFSDKLTIDMFDIYIETSDGDKVIYGNNGNNKIESDSGHDIIYSGNGKDMIDGRLGSDIIYGGAGDDTLYGSFLGWSGGVLDGDDILYGGEGNDFLWGDFGDDRLYGGDDNDHLYDYRGNDWFFGGRGIDVIDGGDGYDIYYLDIEEVEAGNTNIIENFVRDGQRGIDRIRVDVSGTDKIAIESLTTDAMKLDKLKELADIRWATAHINVADTSSDSKSVQNTVIYNTLDTANENDDIILMVLEDFTHELTFDMFEVAIGGTENGDTIRGSDFDDNIYSYAGNDRIHGGDGADRIEGGDGNDSIWGEGGNDIIDGGNGIDKIWGGAGDNIFYLNDKALEDNTDIVEDFSMGDNQIRVRVDVGETQVTTPDELRSATNIRWEVAQKNVKDYRPTVSGSTDDADVDNTIIYRIVGKDDSLTTNTETDDIMLMVLEDYATPLTMEKFSLIIGSDDSWIYQDIIAGPGDDIISGGTGRFNIRGGDGNDIIKGRYEEGSIFGEGGNDIIYGGYTANFIDGGAGIDIMAGHSGDDIFSLDTSALAGNTDIVVDFRRITSTYPPRVDNDLLRVDTVIRDEDTFDTLCIRLGIRIDNTENKIIAGFETGENDASIMDTVIYKVVGTPDNAPNHQGAADDIMLMVLEDFTSLDMSMFDVM